ncbi:RsbRD N-terminal domain-containing protein [uncultured Mailhella sp.]|uniref:RsbRD N-terminal domain-containing protein n=1 Tax=uncultured Mailhella sp. TaxID=1981031 RepID=UPI0025E17ED1|nr:RsbRD N-terminal domain-containing protein [uncultured Mailhella sp.]
MDIAELCSNRREALVDRWVNRFFASYPLDSKGFMRTSRDRFANPVGETTRRSASVLFDAVIGMDTEPDIVKQALHDLIWVRAVQDMPPSKAVGALYLLKEILRSEVLPECLKPENSGPEILKAYLDVESRLDTLGLLALDMYSDARERVFRIRVEEVKRSQSQVIRLAKLRREQAESAPETENRGVEE